MEMPTAMMSSKAQIPEGWRPVRLEEVAEVNPKRPRLGVLSDTPVTFLPMAAVAENSQGIITRESRPYFEVSTGYTYFEENDLLFSKITPCLQNGKHALATGLEGKFGFGTTEFHVVRAGSGLAAPFMFRVLTQAYIIDHCAKSFTGTAGQQRVQPETLNALPILLPPLPEQRAIAAVLDSIDDAVERTEAVIAATGQLRDSLLHQLLTRGVPGWHTEWKEAPGLGTIPAGWEVVRLGEVAKVRNGTTPSRKRADYWDSGCVPFVKTGRVNDILIREPDEFITSEAVANAGAVVVPKGSVLIAMIGQGKTRGMTAKLGFSAAINQNFAAVYEPRVGFDLDFFFAWASHNYPLIRALSQGSNQGALNCELIQRMLSPLPPMAEQEAIASVLDGVDLTIAKAKLERDGLQLLKDSTADSLLTGRVRVDVSLTDSVFSSSA